MRKKFLSVILCFLTVLTTVSIGFVNYRAAAASPHVSVTYEGEETESIAVPQNEKRTVTSNCEYTEVKQYKWQILADINSQLWVDIQDQKEKDLDVSYALISGVIKDNSAYIRAAVVSADGETYYSSPVSVTIMEVADGFSSYAQPKAKAASKSAAKANSYDSEAQALEDDDFVYIRIKYLDAESGAPVYEDYISRIEKGNPFSQPVLSPTVIGFSPWWNPEDPLSSAADAKEPANFIEIAVNGNETEEVVYNVYYKPSEVPFAAKFFYQNLYDNLYTEDYQRYFESTAITGTTIEDDILNAQGNKEGFVPLYHYPESVAADGSTVFECYYDRLYYLIQFDLNGGFGTDPIYARYDTPFLVNEPTFPGHDFVGWEKLIFDEEGNIVATEDVDAFPTNVPYIPDGEKLVYRAKWDIQKVNVNYAFWIEKPNGEGEYTYIDSVTREIDLTDYPLGTISATQDDIDRFAGKIPDLNYFHFGKADENVKIKYDGTTLINIYCDRNRYNARFIFAAEDINGNGTYISNNSAQTDSYANAFGKASDGNKTSQAWKDFIAGADYFEENGKRYFYFELNNLKFEQSISDVWPSQGQYPGTENSNPPRVNSYNDTKNIWRFVGWTPSPDAPYHTTHKNNPVITGLYEDFKTELISAASVADPTKPVDFIMSTTKSDKINTFSYYFQKPGYPADPINETNYELKYQYTIAIDSGNGNQHGGTYNGYEKAKPDESSGNGVNMWYKRLSYNVKVQSYKYTGEFLESAPDSYNRTLQYEAPLDIYLNGDGAIPDISVPPYPSMLEQNAYVFGGYYTTPVFAPGTELKPGDTMPSENIILYAKWTPVSHHVNFFYFEKNCVEYEETGVISLRYYETNPDIPHGDVVMGVVDPDYPGIFVGEEENVFAGWFYYENGVKKAYSPLHMPVNKDLNVFAEWSSQVAQPYIVHYVLESDHSIKVADDKLSYGYQGTTRTESAKLGNPYTQLYPLYRDGYFSAVGSKSIILRPELDKTDPKVNVITFYYSKPTDPVKYIVEYRDADTGELMSDVLGPGNQFETGSYISNGVSVPYGGESIAHKDSWYNVVKDRFVPIPNYTPDAIEKKLILSLDEETNVITFYYKKSNAKLYKVHYMLEKLDSDRDNLIYNTGLDPDGYGSFEESSGYVEAYATENEVFVAPPTWNGYYLADLQDEFGNGNCAQETFDGSGKTEKIPYKDGGYTMKIVENGDELYIYYLRKDIEYKVMYIDKLTGQELIDAKYGTAKYGETVTEYAEEIPYYECETESPQKKVITAENKNGEISPQNIIRFYYVSKQFDILYKVWDKGGGEVFPPSESKLYHSSNPALETIVGSVPTANDGYIFKGWYLDPECTKPVDADWYGDNNRLIPHKEDLIPTTEGTNIFYARFEKMLTGLTIVRENAANEGEGNQTFVYKVTNVTDPEHPSEPIFVTITGNGSVSITELPEGDYTVEQVKDWSWRFDDDAQTKHVGADKTTVYTFDKPAADPYWLNGNGEPVINEKSRGAE